VLLFEYFTQSRIASIKTNGAQQPIEYLLQCQNTTKIEGQLNGDLKRIEGQLKLFGFGTSGTAAEKDDFPFTQFTQKCLRMKTNGNGMSLWK
jgi:hypothetical protein